MSNQPATVRWQLWIVAFGFFMQALDTTIVNTALPSMARSFSVSPAQMHTVIVAYVLTAALMLPASGWLADRIGVKYLFGGAIVLFTTGSLLCGLSQHLDQLVIARVIQGAGGAMMVPVGRLTVLKTVPRSQYMAAMTMVTIPGQVGPLLGPALGGLLVEYASWHWIFFINLPVGVIGTMATLLLLPNHKMRPRPFDLTGFLLLAGGMAALIIVLEKPTFLNGHVGLFIGLIAIGLLAIAGYLRHATGRPYALFPLSLFRTRTFSVGLAGSFCGRIGSGMLPFMTPLFLQTGLGFSPLYAGLMMIPMVIGSMGIKRIVVRVVNRYGYRRVLVVSTLCLALVTLLFMISALTYLYWLLPVILFAQGMLNAMRFSSMNTLTLKDLPDPLASSGNSLLSMVMQLSMSIGVSIAGLLTGLYAGPSFSTGSHSGTGFITVYCCMAVIIAIPALIFMRVPRETADNRLLTRGKRKP